MKGGAFLRGPPYGLLFLYSLFKTDPEGRGVEEKLAKPDHLPFKRSLLVTEATPGKEMPQGGTEDGGLVGVDSLGLDRQFSPHVTVISPKPSEFGLFYLQTRAGLLRILFDTAHVETAAC